jgi:hypothetical protein
VLEYLSELMSSRDISLHLTCEKYLIISNTLHLTDIEAISCLLGANEHNADKEGSHRDLLNFFQQIVLMAKVQILAQLSRLLGMASNAIRSFFGISRSRLSGVLL